MSAVSIDQFVAAQRAKRADRGLADRITDQSAYRLLDGLFAARSEVRRG